MTPKSKKILFVAVTVSVIGIGAFLYMRSKKKGTSLGATSKASGSWKRGDPTTGGSGDEVNKFRIWGYAKENATNGQTPVKYPQITVFTPDGKTQYGETYTGDEKGVYDLWVPDNTYITVLTAPGYLEYKNDARTISNGYKLFMRKVGE